MTPRPPEGPHVRHVHEHLARLQRAHTTMHDAIRLEVELAREEHRRRQQPPPPEPTP